MIWKSWALGSHALVCVHVSSHGSIPHSERSSQHISIYHHIHQQENLTSPLSKGFQRVPFLLTVSNGNYLLKSWASQRQPKKVREMTPRASEERDICDSICCGLTAFCFCTTCEGAESSAGNRVWTLPLTS